MIVDHDGEMGYNIFLSDGTDVTAPASYLSLVQQTHASPKEPYQIMDHVLAHLDDFIPLHEANQPLAAY